MSTQEMDSVRSFAASNSFVEDLPQPVEGNMQDTPESVRNSVIEPRVGMEFDSLLQVIEFYKNYAYSKRFATMTRSSRKNKGFTETSYINLKCNREGRYSSLVDDASKKRSTIKNSCEARIKVSMDITDRKWRILSFIKNHNHDLSQSKFRHFDTFRHISADKKRRLLINDNADVRERRLKCREGDGQALHDYFVRMQGKNSNFYHALDLDDELHVRNVFWVDARSRAAYESFHDVITFDTTYLTNKYDMPFANFIGINYHGESIILGCGLLSDENTDSFVWVFRQWLQSMCGIAPKAIIMDQCQAMRRAIEIVFPETVHRWCIWHITMKLPVKLAGLEAYQDIKHYLLKVVHESMTVEEFEEKWNHTITSHHLKENEWLAKLYEERERWVPAFLNSNFFARMSSTQHSESMNAFFDGYLHSCTTLKERVTVLPDRYILDRWRKDIKRKHTYVSTCTDDVQHNPVLERYEKLHRLAVGVLEIGAESVENFNVLEKLLIDLKDNFPRSCDKQPSSQRKNSVGAASDVVRTEVVGGSAYGDGSTSNMEYPVSMPHSNDGVIDLTNPMPS
uniref:Protein FAR1-RELATED SEQUENCE n=1 Tax=Fagus sylvatica TaxID=28930 RepID=A0A2N9IRB2_FAGSY